MLLKILNCPREIIVAQSPLVTQGSGALKKEELRALIRENTVHANHHQYSPASESNERLRLTRVVFVGGRLSRPVVGEISLSNNVVCKFKVMMRCERLLC